MKSSLLTLTRMGKSRGLCLPAGMIRKHRLDKGVILEDRGHEIVLRAGCDPGKLSWEQTYREMAASGEDWSDWDGASGDGLDETNGWAGKPPAAAKARRSRK